MSERNSQLDAPSVGSGVPRWRQYWNLALTLEEDPPHPERLAAVTPLAEGCGRIRVSGTGIEAAFGDGTQFVEPSPELVQFIAHMYRVPEGYLTGQDNNQLRDTALDRACTEKRGRGQEVPASHFVDTPCQRTLASPSDADRSTVMRGVRRRLWRSIVAYTMLPMFALLPTLGFLALGTVPSVGWYIWLLVAPFAVMTLITMITGLVRVLRGIRLLRLPRPQFQAVMEGRLREAVGANLYALFKHTQLPQTWFHDTLCHRRPISEADIAEFVVPGRGDKWIMAVAVDRALKPPRPL